MISLSRLQVNRLVKQKKRHAVLLAKLKSNPHKLLETILIGNNLVNIAAAALATKLAIDFFGNAGVGIATGVTTFLVLLFGEIIPKTVAVNHRKRISLVIAPVLYALQWILTPIIWFIDGISKVFTGLFGEPEPERVTEEEVLDVVTAGEQDGSLKKREKEMIQNVLEFDDTNVDEIMTPRLDVYCLEMHKTVDEVLDEVLENGISRIPIFNKKTDNMKGVVLVSDLLKAVHAKQGKKTLKDLMQDVLVVPETKKIDSLLRDFQKLKSPFAIVVDEHGLFIGVVTVEDVLEELVGEIYDERDKQEPEVKKLDNNVFLVPGRMTIYDLNQRHGFSLPEAEDYDTLAGYLLDLVGKLPKEGKEYKDEHHVFIVEKLRQNRIEFVKVTRKDAKKVS